MTVPATGVAIVGIDVCVPGSSSLFDLSASLQRGSIVMGPFPEPRLRDVFLPPDPVKYHDGSYFSRIDRFDASKFKLSARVAEAMDPLQRACLSSAARAITDAGLTDLIRGSRTAVFAAVPSHQASVYERLQRNNGADPDIMAVLLPSVAARISHVYDLHGLAAVIDCACSSSLVAVALAADHLMSGLADWAVVTAANLIIEPGMVGTEAVNVVSASGIMRPFDQFAAGTSFGEGVMSVVLSRPAIDTPCYAWLEGWSVNEDGHTATMAAPNPIAQKNVIEAAWRMIDDPHPVAVVTHGTGTLVGDAIEIEALVQADPFRQLALSSVGLVAPKANLGHMDAASGLFSVCVAVASFAADMVPPHPSFVAPGVGDKLADSPFFVPVRPEPLGTGEIGVSSFGMTGTNAHVVLRRGNREPTPAPPDPPGERHWFITCRNSFAQALTANLLDRHVAMMSIDPMRDWEIGEHRVNGSPMLVGAAVFEVVAQVADLLPGGLVGHEIVNLVLHEPLRADAGPVCLAVAVDLNMGRGRITATGPHIADMVWASFEIRPSSGKPLAVEGPSGNLVSVPISVTVGDEGFLDVSQRWQVAQELLTDEQRRSGQLRARVPASYRRESTLYRFYPPLMDAALNAINGLVADRIVVPGRLGRVVFHEPQLDGDSLVSTLRCDLGKSDPASGRWTLDADIVSAGGKPLISVRDYVVCALPGHAQPEPWHRFGWVDADETGSGATEILTLDTTTTAPLWKQAWDVCSKVIELGSKPGVDRVVVVAPESFYGAGEHSARLRAVAAAAYSMRTEVRADVAVLDAGPEEGAAWLRTHSCHGIMALRNNRGLQARFLPTSLHFDGAPPSLRSMLVIGASSGIGQAFVTWLHREVPELHVIAAGRRPRHLTQLPQNIPYVQVDITDQTLVDHLAASIDSVDVVLSFAGLPASGLFAAKAPSEFARVMAPKTEGADALVRAFAKARQIVFVGSLAGYVGAMGQAEYSAGNAYLSALAAGQADRRIRCLTLGGWADVGMSAGRGDDVFARLGGDDGYRLIYRFLSANDQEGCLFTVSPQGSEYSPLLESARTTVAKPPTVPSPAPPTPRNAHILSPAPVDSERIIRDAWIEVLGEGDYASDASFFDSGGDSVSVVRLADALEVRFPGVFDVTTLFAQSTIDEQLQVLLHMSQEAPKETQYDISAVHRLIQTKEV